MQINSANECRPRFVILLSHITFFSLAVIAS